MENFFFLATSFISFTSSSFRSSRAGLSIQVTCATARL